MLVAATSLYVSGCTPTTGPDIAAATYGIAPIADPNQTPLENNAEQAAAAPLVAASVMSGEQKTLADGQAFVPGAPPPSAVLPEALAAATNLNPNAGAVANSTTYVTQGVEKTIDTAKAAPLTPLDLAGQVPAPTAAPEALKQTASLDVGQTANETAVIPSDPVVSPKSARPVAPAKPTLFGSLFANKPKSAQQSLTAAPAEADSSVQLASLDVANDEPAAQSEAMSSLPGVNAKNLFALDPAKIAGDEPFDDEPEVQVASATAGGLARLAPNGLLMQTDHVDVSCFKPQLVSVLKSVERHYGKKVMVTSGFRSSKGNRRAGGSRNSLHISCAAADIQIEGVGKWQLAKYLRTMPGRGGVGTYCHTESVHIDIGSERDWNWRCRRR